MSQYHHWLWHSKGLTHVQSQIKVGYNPGCYSYELLETNHAYGLYLEQQQIFNRQQILDPISNMSKNLLLVHYSLFFKNIVLKVFLDTLDKFPFFAMQFSFFLINHINKCIGPICLPDLSISLPSDIRLLRRSVNHSKHLYLFYTK